MATYSKVTGITSNLSVRKDPNTNGTLLFSIYNDEVVQVLSGQQMDGRRSDIKREMDTLPPPI